MYVWKSKNRRDRRHFREYQNPFLVPTPNDVEDFKKWFDQAKDQDEAIRMRHESIFVDGYTNNRLRIFKEFLATDMGKKDLRLICLELARQKEEANRKVRRASLRLAETNPLDDKSSVIGTNDIASTSARRRSSVSGSGRDTRRASVLVGEGGVNQQRRRSSAGMISTINVENMIGASGRRRSSVIVNPNEPPRRRSSVATDGDGGASQVSKSKSRRRNSTSGSYGSARRWSSASVAPQEHKKEKNASTDGAAPSPSEGVGVRRKSSEGKGLVEVNSTEKTSVTMETENAETAPTPNLAQTGPLAWLPGLTLTLNKGFRLKASNTSVADDSEAQRAVDMNEAEARKIFGMFDGDGSGSIDVEELKALLDQMCIPLKDDEVRDLMEEMDKDKSNSIDFDEFYAWYQTEAQRQKKDRFFKSVGLHVNKLLRAVAGLTVEHEAQVITLAYEEYQARTYAQKLFRASRPPQRACSTCNKGFADQEELQEHIDDDINSHQEWREKQATVHERFTCVRVTLEGPLGRRMKCIRAQFDPCLHTPDQIELNAAPMPDRPMLADPDSRRMKQMVRGMCVETLSIYFGKRAPPPIQGAPRLDCPFKPHDLPLGLASIVMRLYQNDRAIFMTRLKHQRAPQEDPPNMGVTSRELLQISSPTNRSTKMQNRRARFNLMRPTDSGFSVLVQGHGEDGVHHDFRFKNGKEVYLLGNFNGWQEELMQFDYERRDHFSNHRLSVGIYLYCFRDQGKLKLDLNKPTIGKGAQRRNILVVWDTPEYEGPTKEDLEVNLAQQNIRDYGTWFFFSSIELLRPFIIHIDLSFNAITNHGIEGISHVLDVMPHLRTLKLNSNSIAYEGAKAVGEALGRNIGLAVLELADNPLGDDGVEAIAEGMRGNGNLNTLVLDKTIMAEDGLQCLAEALLYNAALRSLSLRLNRFGTAGACMLEQALLRNATLTSLNLAHNELGPNGGQSMARLLVGNDSIKALTLSRCGIGKDRARHGFFYLAEALWTNRTLQSLALNGSSADNFAATTFARSIVNNVTLTELDLSNNALLDDYLVDHKEPFKIYTETDPEGISSIDTTLRRNKECCLSSNEEELYCPQAKVEGEWQTDRRWKSRQEVEQQNRDCLQEEEDHRQAEEDAAIKLAVNQVLEQTRSDLTHLNGWQSRQLIEMTMRGLRGVEENGGDLAGLDLESILTSTRRKQDKASSPQHMASTPLSETLAVKDNPNDGSSKGKEEQKEAQADGQGEEEEDLLAPMRKEVIPLFQAYDKDRSNSLNLAEFTALFQDQCTPITSEEIMALMGGLSKEQPGEINLEEFLKWWIWLRRRRNKFDKQTKKLSLKVKRFFVNVSETLLRAEALRTIITFNTRACENETRANFRQEHPPNFSCDVCNQAFAYDEPKHGLTPHKSEARMTHEELQRQEYNIGPKMFVVEKAMEIIERRVTKAWPKLFVLTKHVPKNKPFPVLDTPDELVGRVIGGLEPESSVKGLSYRGAWLQIEYKGNPDAWVRRRKGLIVYYAVLLTSNWTPSSSALLNKTLRSFAEAEDKIKMDAATTAETTTITDPLPAGNDGSITLKTLTKSMSSMGSNTSEALVQTLGLRKLARRLQGWPLPVGAVDHFRGERYYKASPTLPTMVQLKVRTQPKMDARVIGVLPLSMMVRATAMSGDWILIQFGDGTHAGHPGWMLTRNRQGTELLVPETNQYQIARALAANVSPFPCAEDKTKGNDANLGDDMDDDEGFENMVDTLATRDLPEDDEEMGALNRRAAPSSTFSRLVKKQEKVKLTKRQKRRGI